MIKHIEGLKRRFRYRLASVAVLISLIAVTSCKEESLSSINIEEVDFSTLAHFSGAQSYTSPSIVLSPSSVRVLRLRLTSTVDFIKAAKAGGYHLRFVAYECLDKKRIGANFFAPTEIWAGGKPIEGGQYASAENLDNLRDSLHRISYEVAIPRYSENLRKFFEELPKESVGARYDLFNPEKLKGDVCLEVAGGSIWGSRFQSMTAVVSKQQIALALRNAKPLQN